MESFILFSNPKHFTHWRQRFQTIIPSYIKVRLILMCFLWYTKFDHFLRLSPFIGDTRFGSNTYLNPKVKPSVLLDGWINKFTKKESINTQNESLLIFPSPLVVINWREQLLHARFQTIFTLTQELNRTTQSSN